MTPVSHGKPCAGNPHARFDEGASASEEPRRKALLHQCQTSLHSLCYHVLRFAGPRILAGGCVAPSTQAQTHIRQYMRYAQMRALCCILA